MKTRLTLAEINGRCHVVDADAPTVIVNSDKGYLNREAAKLRLQQLVREQPDKYEDAITPPSF